MSSIISYLDANTNGCKSPEAESFDWESHETRKFNLQQLQRYVLLDQLQLNKFKRELIQDQRRAISDQRQMAEHQLVHEPDENADEFVTYMNL